MINVRDANNNIVQVDNPTQEKQQELIDAIAALNLKIDALNTELAQKLEAGQSVNVGNFPATQNVAGTVTANTGLSQPLTDTQLRASNVNVAVQNQITGFATQTTLASALTAIEATNTKIDALQAELNQKLESGQSVNVGNFPATQNVAGTVTANTGLSQPLTDSQLRASNVNVAVQNQITGFATQTTLASALTAIEATNTKIDALQAELNQKLESGQSVNIGNFPATQNVAGTVTANTGLSQPLTDTQLRASNVNVTVSNPTANPETGLAKEIKQDSIITALQNLLQSVYDEDSPHVSGAKGQLMLAIRSDNDTFTADNGDYTVFKLDEEGRLKVSSKPASYPDVTGNITTTQPAIGTPVLGGTVTADVSRCSNVVMYCTGIFSTANCSFEASIESTGENWFAIQAVRTNANTIETTTGNLSAAPAYAWEMSVNGYARVRVRCTTLGGGTQAWRVKLGTYATEPIPAAQISATQPVSGTVTVTSTTANIGTSGLSIFTDSSTNLAAAAAFTGTSRDGGTTAAFNRFVANAVADQAGTLRIEKSTDNTNWRRASADIPVAANTGVELPIFCTARYHRVVFTNTSGSTQTQFLLTSAYLRI